ncbi:tail fiber domain-containing protein, partial [Pseudomonas shirazensis]
SPDITDAELSSTTADGGVLNGMSRLIVGGTAGGLYKGLPTQDTYAILTNRGSTGVYAHQIASGHAVNRLYFRRASSVDFEPLSKAGDYGWGPGGELSNMLGATGTNLNDVLVPGSYGQNANGNASLLLNYPVAVAGTLFVQGSSSSITTQQYITYNDGRHFVRSRYATIWSPWREQVVVGDAGIGLSSAAALPGNTLLASQPSGFWGGTSQGTAGMPVDTSNNGTGIWTASYTGTAFHFAIATVSRKFHFGYSAGNGTAVQSSEVFHQNNSGALPLTTHLAPSTDNNRQLGTSGTRWSVVYSATGAINTSDAREKTSVTSLTARETEAAKQLSREIGTYKWLKMVEEKGDGARKHIGLTVQRAIQIMESCGLDPFSYGFICYDEWEDEFEHSEAVTEPVMTEEVWGNDPEGLAYLVSPSVQALDEHGEPMYRVITEAADVQVKWGGNRYSFRYDELNLFIAAGIEARLSELEKRM